jgi:lia operon protein LiaF
VFTVIFSSIMLYIGRKKYDKFWGKVLFWVGLILIVITILNMFVVRFLLIAGMVLFLIHYQRSKKTPEIINPKLYPNKGEEREPLITIEPLLQQRLFGDQKTSDEAFRWNDINIFGGFGNRIIDLSKTVLPDEPVISIRHFIGNIKIYVPYDVEVSVHHSSLFGRTKILGEVNERLINHSLSYRTKDYHRKKPCVNIITSIWSGDLEVRRT